MAQTINHEINGYIGFPGGGLKSNSSTMKLSYRDIDLVDDDKLSNYLPLVGGVMIGTLTLNGLPTEDDQAASKLYVDQQVAALEGNALTFKGFVSSSQPTNDVREGNLWLTASDLNTTFPWNVYTYVDGSWSNTTTQYTPIALDLWAKTSDHTGWYYFGEAWNPLDFAGSTFNDRQFAIINGVVNLASGCVTNNEIAINANIDASKINLNNYYNSSIVDSLLNSKANTNSVVLLTGAQTVAGIKTFSSIPVLPTSDPTSANQATRKGYVDAQVATKVTTGTTVNLTGNQSIDGTKTFTTIPVLPSTNPASANQAARKGYVDTAVSTKLNSSEYNFYTGYTTVTTVVNIPVTKRSVLCNITANGTLSLSGTLATGKEMSIKIRNSGSVARIITLSNNTTWESKNKNGGNVDSVEVPAGGSTEINIWALDKLIVKTD